MNSGAWAGSWNFPFDDLHVIIIPSPITMQGPSSFKNEVPGSNVQAGTIPLFWPSQREVDRLSPLLLGEIGGCSLVTLVFGQIGGHYLILFDHANPSFWPT
jgi:hypothetical protein